MNYGLCRGYESVHIPYNPIAYFGFWVYKLKDLKQFLFVRDTYKVFDKIKGNMQIGIPCLVVSETECILDLDKLNEL